MALLPYTLLYILQIVVRQIISFQLSAQQSLRTPVRCRLCAVPRRCRVLPRVRPPAYRRRKSAANRRIPPPNTAGVRDSFIIGFCNSLVKKHREPLSTFSERLILLNHSSNISQNTTKIPVQNLENSLIFCNFAPKLMI